MIAHFHRYFRILRDPVKKALKQGFKREVIEAKLKEKHWPQKVIDKTFKKIEHESSRKKKRSWLNILYFLGLLVALSSFIWQDYFIILISVGILLILLSVPLRMREKKEVEKATELEKKEKPFLTGKKPDIPTAPVGKKTVPVVEKEKKQSFLSKLFKRKPEKPIKKDEYKLPFDEEDEEEIELSKFLKEKPIASPIIPPSKKKESILSKLFKRKPEKKLQIPKIFKDEEKHIKKELGTKEKIKKIEKEEVKLEKNPVIAMLLSLIIPGLGQVYNGQTKKAIIILLTSWLVIPWIYGVIDAYKTAKGVVKPKKTKEKKELELKSHKEEEKPIKLVAKSKEKIETKKEPSKPGEKKKLNLVPILMIFALAAVIIVFWLYFINVLTELNLITYSVLIVIVTLIMLAILKRKGRTKSGKPIEKEVKRATLEEIKKEMKKSGEGYETDFDKLHQLVQKFGRIKITDVAETFKISKKEAEEWAEILEHHNLARMYYPTVGSPELRRLKKEKKEEDVI